MLKGVSRVSHRHMSTTLKPTSTARFVYVTAPPAEASALAREAVSRKLAACVQTTRVNSIYEWKGEICDEPETMLTFKTVSSRVEDLASYIKSKHSYDTPEILVTNIEKGSSQYLEWLEEVCCKES